MYFDNRYFEKGLENFRKKLEGNSGQEIFVAKQMIRPYGSNPCVEGPIRRPLENIDLYFGVLGDGEAEFSDITKIPMEAYVSKTKDSVRGNSGWRFFRGRRIEDIFDFSAFGKFEINSWLLNPNTNQNGLWVYVGDEIEQNREDLNNLGYGEARKLFDYEQSLITGWD